jgi:hypothetical protein
MFVVGSHKAHHLNTDTQPHTEPTAVPIVIVFDAVPLVAFFQNNRQVSLTLFISVRVLPQASSSVQVIDGAVSV